MSDLEGRRGGGGGPGRRARGRRWGGAPESSVGATRRALTFWAPLKNLTIGLIWLVTRGGGVGGVGQGGGQGGEMGGGTREQCGLGRRARGGRLGGAPRWGGGHRRVGGVGVVGGGATTTYASKHLGRCGGGPGRRAGGRGRWVRERGRSGRGGQLSFWGMKGVPGRKGVKWRGLTRCGGHQDTRCQRACEQRTMHWFHRLPLIP